MKKLLTVLAVAGVAFSGELHPLVKEKGCISCHDLEASKAGPPFKVIAKEYKGKENAVETLAKSIRSGSMMKWQGLAEKYGINITMAYMPAQHGVSEEEAKKIAEWILSLEK
ncbi:MAG: c-type cytochrome [Aquificae bacterium]|nr:c-type cytochrome [Aquificota bacterium]